MLSCKLKHNSAVHTISENHQTSTGTNVFIDGLPVSAIVAEVMLGNDNFTRKIDPANSSSNIASIQGVFDQTAAFYEANGMEYNAQEGEYGKVETQYRYDNVGNHKGDGLKFNTGKKVWVSAAKTASYSYDRLKMEMRMNSNSYNTKQVHGFTGKLDIVIVDLEKGNNYSVSANFTGHNPKEGGVVARSTIIGIDISASAKDELGGNMKLVKKNPKLAQQSRVYFKYNLYDNGTSKEYWGSFPKPMNNWVFHNDGIFFDDVPPIEP